MRDLLQDFRYGMRVLINRPGFTLVAALVLGLGIGANTAMFSLVNALLLKPPMIHNPDEVVGCYSRDTQKPDSYRAFSYPNYIDLRDANPIFAGLMAHSPAMVGITEGGATRRVFADVVSSNYFATYGIPLFRGREFTPAEERPGADAQVAIVSYSYWKKNGADPSLSGKTIRVNGRIFNIVGVTPEGFTGGTALLGLELYLPLSVYGTVVNGFEGQGRSLSARDNHALILVGRLKPGLALRDSDPQLAVVASQLAKAYPAENRNQTFIARPLARMSISDNPQSDTGLRLPAILLLSMSAVVLLIASLNVANMMLAQGAARRKEMAIRLAIGGGRARIVRQLFTEGLLLALLGGAAGLAVSSWSTSILVNSLTRLAPFEVVYSAGPDIRVLAATTGFCLLSTILFGLGPALKISRPDLIADLKETTLEDRSTGFRRVLSRRNLLVTSQLALSLMLVTAAGLFVRSALRAANVEPGFAIENSIIAEVDPSLAGYSEVRGRQVYSALIARLRSIPGVESASLAATVPFGMISFGKGLHDAARNNGPRVDAAYNIVSDGYFETLVIPLLRGRAFLPGEMVAGATRHVAILDKLAAEKLWGSQDPLGKHIRLDGPDPAKPPEDLEVVGVVGEIRNRIIGGGPRPYLYVPLGQQYMADMQVHLKTRLAAGEAQARMLDTVRREIRALDEHLPVLALRTLRDHLNASFDLWIVRTGANLLAIFAGIALVLAVVGLYGVKAYTVARRTREIGIRMALGARPADTLRLILGEGLLVSLAGVGAGLVLSLVLGKILAGILYDVSAFDTVVMVTAPAILIVTSLVACYVPARRAARVDPMVALRYE